MLHARDKAPVRFERVCVRDGKPVAWEELVKGYEYAKGRFVVMTKEDFQAAAVEKTRTVDIVDFVEADAIDDRFFDTPYYVVPAKGGERVRAPAGGDPGVGLDLMERLRRSLEQSGAARKRPRSRAAARRVPARTRKRSAA
jgi:non-homologous end joining protein Ku